MVNLQISLILKIEKKINLKQKSSFQNKRVKTQNQIVS